MQWESEESQIYLKLGSRFYQETNWLLSIIYFKFKTFKSPYHTRNVKKVIVASAKKIFSNEGNTSRYQELRIKNKVRQ